jgi:hypothetical protein
MAEFFKGVVADQDCSFEILMARFKPGEDHRPETTQAVELLATGPAEKVTIPETSLPFCLVARLGEDVCQVPGLVDLDLQRQLGSALSIEVKDLGIVSREELSRIGGVAFLGFPKQ